MVTMIGINVGMVKSMLERHYKTATREGERWQEIERGIFELRAILPLEYVRREEARWRILRVVDAGRPIAGSEQIVWRVLSDIKLALTQVGLRRELSYLRDSGLLELEGESGETWFARLTASGVDVVEYNYPAPAGVARPKKYW